MRLLSSSTEQNTKWVTNLNGEGVAEKVNEPGDGSEHGAFHQSQRLLINQFISLLSFFFLPILSITWKRSSGDARECEAASVGGGNERDSGSLQREWQQRRGSQGLCSGETVKSSDCGLVMMNRFEEIHGGEEEMRLFVFPRRQRGAFFLLRLFQINCSQH